MNIFEEIQKVDELQTIVKYCINEIFLERYGNNGANHQRITKYIKHIKNLYDSIQIKINKERKEFNIKEYYNNKEVETSSVIYDVDKKIESCCSSSKDNRRSCILSSLSSDSDESDNSSASSIIFNNADKTSEDDMVEQLANQEKLKENVDIFIQKEIEKAQIE